MPEDDDLSNQIQGRFNPGSSGGTTEDTTESTSTDSETTRSMAQYSMYLPEELERDLSTLYQQIKLERLQDAESGLEKNRHYNCAIVETALAHEDEIRDRVDELTK